MFILLLVDVVNLTLEQRHMHLYNVVRTRMLHSVTLKSFSTWKTTTIDNLRLKRVGRRAMAVLSRRFLLSSLYQWKKNVEAKMCAKNIGKYLSEESVHRVMKAL